MRQIEVDLNAIRSNYAALRAAFAPAKVMAVVKANAYGHGMIEVARALDGNVDALGVADLSEAIALRDAGIKARVMAWIIGPEDDLQAAVANNIELGVSTFDAAQFHIKIDTGLGRNGFSRLEFDQLFTRLQGTNPVGIFSHLSNTSVSDDLKQKRIFEDAISMASSKGIEFRERHLAASAGALSYEDLRYDMVRCGIAVYGLNPFEDRELAGIELQPAMRVLSQLVNVKKVPAGQGVSYGYRYVTERETNLGLVPFGYAEGMPRVSVNHEVLIAGKLFPVVGKVAMDQFVVDLGSSEPAIGTEVVIFGNPQEGEPSAEALGESAGTINYEIVTRIGGRANRSYLGR
ncbi:MAG: alanine racemase [Actinobacteria bacterium]|nr:alanine racemase [Actinomycetota bacterium]